VSDPQKRIWITWENQVRNRSLSKLLNAKLFEIVGDETTPIKRYVKSAWLTVCIIRKEKPIWVFHQNPSIFLGLLLVILRPFFRYSLVTDTHNAGIRPAEGKYAILNWIGRLVSKKTDLLIVHNEMIAADCKAFGAAPFVLSDPLPEFSDHTVEANPNKIVFVCRWSDDEPYQEVIAAYELARHENPNLELYITGRPPDQITLERLPDGIFLTGFVSDQEYSDLLKSSALMIVLTNRMNSLNCGAYEALSLAKPCILFDSDLLKEFFSEGFVYTDLRPENIALSINKAIKSRDYYSRKLEENRARYVLSYDQEISEISKRCN